MTTGQRAGSLLSVNVGLPQDVAWHGQVVHTAVWKRPAAGPVMARRLNLDGDGQGDLAGHGGEHRAVFVYQIESYRYWQEQLGRDDFSHGQFGENFTVQGLADDQVRIGDRYRIGEAVFEVTQPRVTCYRVGIRMGEPRMPALLVSHRRPGFYFRVLREGAVQAGDEIVQVAAGPEPMTVAEVDALLYLPGHTRERIQRALRIPALPEGWKASFQAMLGQPGAGGGATGNAGLTAVSPPPAWPGFRPLAVTAVEPESASVVSVHLADPGGGAVPPALPGQFLTLRLPVSPGAQPLLRSYSLSGAPGAGSYRISVKREPHGAGSQFIHTRIRAGDRLEVAAPRGTFVLRPGETPVLLISAGVGATPVMAMLHALAAARSGRDIWWLHGARSRAEEPFAAESRSLLAALPSGHRHICYSRPGPGDARGRDYQTLGRLSAPVLAALGLPHDADAYICGPAAFMAEVSAALAGMGIGARVRTEIFGAAPAQTPGIAPVAARPPHPPAGDPGGGPQVGFARSGLTVRWDPGYASLLELAEACDVPVRWSCRTGVCHTCETALMSGTVGYRPDPVDDPADGSALICCSQPRGDLVLDL
ncbi:MAG TPA: MOSC and FAD-binding oxidoreductase domain-containing protein [Streptosporangiaceae bacterium]|nr:MOSC and FAD-binding oxidoreductase domain-containing protein [Streptosporangiaceae bacterium]